jgi:3-isopropylmalate/(R)-2-methylmalate dehydratase small subunit
MNTEPIGGIAHVYGDNIDTDRIIPGKYTKTLDTATLAAHVLEDLDPAFARTVRPGDLLVAGYNFGCGSSREQAPLAIKAAGVAAVIARSVARIFYRNAIMPGDRVSVDLAAGSVINHTRDETYHAAAMPPQMVAILAAGGLVNYLLRYGDYV